MSDRLADLRRQRALVQEQLAWIDREIAALGHAAPPPAPRVAPASTLTPPADLPPSEAADYQPDPVAAHSAARRGCLMYTVIALVVFAGVLAAIYFYAYRDHPLLFVTDRPAATAPTPK